MGGWNQLMITKTLKANSEAERGKSNLFITLCSIGNGAGIILDTLYKRYFEIPRGSFCDGYYDIFALSNSWDLRELSIEKEVSTSEANINFSRATIFISCLGGYTVPTLLPYYVNNAEEQGSKIFVYFTMPFSFEGADRVQKAYTDFENLRHLADCYLLDEFNTLTLKNASIERAFKNADERVIKTLVELHRTVLDPSLISFDFNDFLLVSLKEKGRLVPFMREIAITDNSQEDDENLLIEKCFNEAVVWIAQYRSVISGVVLDVSMSQISFEKESVGVGKDIMNKINYLLSFTFPVDTEIRFTLNVEKTLSRRCSFKIFLKIIEPLF